MIQLAILSSHCWSFPYVLFSKELLPDLSSKSAIPHPFLPKSECYLQVLTQSFLVAPNALKPQISTCLPVLPQVSFLLSQWRFISISCLLFFLILFPFPPNSFPDLRCPLRHFKSFHHCFQLFYLAWNLKNNYILLKFTLRRNPQCIIIISSLCRKIQKYGS